MRLMSSARRVGRLIGMSLRLYRLLIRVYPAGFRRQFGVQMVQVFRDGCWDAAERAGSAGLVCWWGRALWDLVCSAAKEHHAVRATRRQQMADGNRRGDRAGSAGSTSNQAGRRRTLWRLIGFGLLWGVLVQIFRDYGRGVPILGRIDFVWIEALAVVLLLTGLARWARGWSAPGLGLLVAICGISVLVGHYGYYAGALALGAGQAARVDVDLADAGAYRFLWDIFTAGLARGLLWVELGGFALGWAWGTLLRRLRLPHTVPAGDAA
jgi:hypothetical protein